MKLGVFGGCDLIWWINSRRGQTGRRSRWGRRGEFFLGLAQEDPGPRPGGVVVKGGKEGQITLHEDEDEDEDESRCLVSRRIREWPHASCHSQCQDVVGLRTHATLVCLRRFSGGGLCLRCPLPRRHLTVEGSLTSLLTVARWTYLY